MAEELPAGFRYIDEPAPAQAETLPAGFRYLDQNEAPAPLSISDVAKAPFKRAGSEIASGAKQLFQGEPSNVADLLSSGLRHAAGFFTGTPTAQFQPGEDPLAATLSRVIGAGRIAGSGASGFGAGAGALTRYGGEQLGVPENIIKPAEKIADIGGTLLAPSAIANAPLNLLRSATRFPLNGINRAVSEASNAEQTAVSTQAGLAEAEANAFKQIKSIYSKMSPEQAYAEYNAARVIPETLPVVELPNTTAAAQRLGGNLTSATTGLPKSVGPNNMMEKLTVDLNKMTSEAGAEANPAVLKTFGTAWNSLSPEARAAANSQYIQNLGIGGDELALINSGKLRLDQADRLLQQIGPKASDSKLASHLYWSIMEDLRNSTSPMVQGLLKAKSIQRQDIAAGDIASMLQPTVDKFGRPTVSTSAIKNLKQMFTNYNQDPKLLDWKDKLLVESIPADKRSDVLDVVNNIFRQREAVANLPKAAESKMGLFAHGLAGATGAAIGGAAGAATGIPHLGFAGAVAGARGGVQAADKLYQTILRAAVKPQGKAFLQTLYADTPPMVGDMGKLAALQNFVSSGPQ